MSEDRFLFLRLTLGNELFEKIQNANIFVVGAGGIGSELLKNLVQTGFTKITVLDLDTIDVSNLNRQFLFRKQHVGMPKSQIARDAVLKYNPNINITALHMNIMDPLSTTRIYAIIRFSSQYHLINLFISFLGQRL